MQRSLSSFLITAFLLVVLFSVLLTMPLSHDMHCPFASGCVSTVEHLDHWQGTFASVLSEIVAMVAVFVVIVLMVLPNIVPVRAEYLRRISRVPRRPTLLQELFSQGILNRKEDPSVR